MKIGFTGAQGVGKTTLLDLFLINNPDYIRSSNIQRILHTNYNVGINDKAKFEGQYAITAHYAAEVSSYTNYVADRTIIDTFVYASVCKQISRDQYDELVSTFEKGISFYDIIFYLPIEFVPPEDGIRIIDNKFRYEVDSRMKMLVDKYSNTTKIVTVTGTIEERYNQIKKEIDDQYRLNKQ